MTSKLNVFERILTLIPGYTGYSQRLDQRNTDTLVRARITAVLGHCEQVLETRLADALKSRQEDAAAALERCRKRINTLTSRVRYAPIGQSGVMSHKPFTEVELEKMMRLDLEILDTVSGLAERIDDLPAADLQTIVDRIARNLDDRNSFMEEYK